VPKSKIESQALGKWVFRTRWTLRKLQQLLLMQQLLQRFQLQLLPLLICVLQALSILCCQSTWISVCLSICM